MPSLVGIHEIKTLGRSPFLLCIPSLRHPSTHADRLTMSFESIHYNPSVGSVRCYLEIPCCENRHEDLRDDKESGILTKTLPWREELRGCEKSHGS